MNQFLLISLPLFTSLSDSGLCPEKVNWFFVFGMLFFVLLLRKVVFALKYQTRNTNFFFV